MNAKSITTLTEAYLCPPISDTSIIKNLLKDEYGLTATSLTPLKGYEDRNYHATVKEDHSNEFLRGQPVKDFIVKVVNPEDSKIADYIDGQRLVMAHLNKRGIVAQTEIPNIKGGFFSHITLPRDGAKYRCIVSVRRFLDGDVVAKNTLTPVLLYQLGAFLANFDKALEDFECEFYNTFDCLWSLNNTPKVREVVNIIQDPQLRNIVTDVIDVYEKEVKPVLKDCRQGQIHGDPNEQNILVVPDPERPSGLAISGVLDLQESAKTYHIYDVAAMSAYMMMHTKTNVNPIDSAGHVLAGYTSKEGLRPSEKSSLRALIGARMAMSLSYGAFVHSKNPTNNYVLTTGQIGWSVLSQFWLTPRADVEGRWEEIVQSYHKNL